jgi:hypothetical protein
MEIETIPFSMGSRGMLIFARFRRKNPEGILHPQDFLSI